MAASSDSILHDDVANVNIIVIPLKKVLLYTTIGDDPEYETKRPLKTFVSVSNDKRNAILDSIASRAFHVVVDPLYYDEEFLNLVKMKCFNIKRLTIDANLLGVTGKLYKKYALNDGSKTKQINGEEVLEKAIRFIAGFDQIDEIYFGPQLNWVERIYKARKWGFVKRFGDKVGFYKPILSSDIIHNLNYNLKTIFFDNIDLDMYDLRDGGISCSTVIRALPLSQAARLEEMEGGPSHICLNKLSKLKLVFIDYFETCFHSYTVNELVLKTLSGDHKVHEMFPNLKKIRVKMFCPFVMDLAHTGNAGLYDGVVLDELEVEEQIPCFCDGGHHIESLDATLQSLLHSAFVSISVKSKNRSKTRKTIDACHCTDVAGIGTLETLKIIKIHCFDATVARFITKLQANGNQAKIILYEKSRFERNADHHSLWDNLDKLAETIKIVPRNKIEIVMKKVDAKSLKHIKGKLADYIPDNVKISFTD